MPRRGRGGSKTLAMTTTLPLLPKRKKNGAIILLFVGVTISCFSWQVTRYQNWPGQSTAYMVGRLGVLKARYHATQSLGDKFNQKDFHYQVVIFVLL